MTIFNSLREVSAMPIHGLSNGSQPVAGYNLGAGKYRRVRETIRFNTLSIVIYSLVFWAVAMALPEPLIRIFNDEPEIIAAGVPALRLYFSLFPFMSLQISGQAMFVGLGKSRHAVFFSLLRKAFINAPLTVIFPLWMGTSGVFGAEAFSQLAGGLACIITMYFTVYRPLGKVEDGAPLPGRL